MIALAVLIAAAAAAEEPLVDAARLIPDAILEIKYATADNVAGRKLYPAARCLLRESAARRLAAAAEDLRARGYRLKLFDCYRPLSVQRALWAVKPDERYVADPAKGSRHNRGAAVDLTLADRDGQELDMPSAYDDFSERAHRGSGTPAQRANARLLEDAMRRRGFTGVPTEWWHFDAAGWKAHPLSDAPFDPPGK